MAQIPRPKSQNAAQVYKAFELTADFVVGLDAAALDDARIELTKNVKRFEDHFQTVNGRKPTRQEMAGSISDEVRALIVIANERKRRDRLGRVASFNAGRRAAKGPPQGANGALLEQSTAGAQNAALTRELMAAEADPAAGLVGAAGSAGAAPNVSNGLTFTRDAAEPAADADSTVGGWREKFKWAEDLPTSATMELLVNWVQFLSLTNVLFVRGVEIMGLRGVPVGNLQWVQDWRSYMAWTALFNLDFTLVAERYPRLTLLTSLSWGAQYLILTVLLPLTFAFLTVLLIKDLTSVVWILVLTASLLATIFVIAAKAILGAEQSNPAYEVYLQQTDFILYMSIVSLFLCAASYAIKKIYMLREKNLILMSEIDHLRSAAGAHGGDGSDHAHTGFGGRLGGGVFGGRGYGLISPGSSPASSPSPSAHSSPPGSPGHRHRHRRAHAGSGEDDEHRTSSFEGEGGTRGNLSPSHRASRHSDASSTYAHGHTPRSSRLGGISAIRPTTAAETAEYELALQTALEQSVAEPPPLMALLRNAALLLLCVAGLLFGMIRLLAPELYSSISYSQRAAITTLVLAIVFTVMVGSSTWLSFFRAGRRLLEVVQLTFRSYYIGFLLVVLQMLYIPVTKALMSVWNCKESSCRVGEWYPVASPQLSGAATLATLQDNAQSCQPCPFYPRGAFTNFSELNGRTFGEVSDFVSSISTKTCAIASQLCPAVASLRLVESPNLECREQVWPFTGIASALMLLIFTAGTPFIYGFLIREHSRRYDALPADPAADPDDQWAWRVQPSVANKARNLYSDFEFKWRYYKLFVLFQKLALVGTLLYVGDFPIVAAMAFTFIHAAFLIINSIMRPYLDPRPDMLAIAVSIVSTFNPLMALVAFVNLGVPEWMGLAMLLINVLVPVLFILVGIACRINQREKKAKAAARRARESIELGSDDGIVPWDPDAQYLKLARMQVDRGINEYTMRFLVNFFAVVLVLCFVCASVIMLGWFHTAVRAPVTGPVTNSTLPVDAEPCILEQSVTKLEFLQYGSWREFVKHCCCMPRDYEGDVPLTELWACDNGLYKERTRRLSAEDRISGVRHFCGTVFLANSTRRAAPEVQPKWNATAQRIGVEFLGEVVFDYW